MGPRLRGDDENGVYAKVSVGRSSYGFGGYVSSHFLPGSCVGGNGLSPGSILTLRGFFTLPPRGPTSRYSPGLLGFSPGFCVGISALSRA